MKRLITVLSIILVALLLFGCQQAETSNTQVPMGIYQPDKLLFLGEESAFTPADYLEKNKFVLFAFDENSFTIDTQGSPDPTISKREFTGVTYEESSIGDSLKLGYLQTRVIDLSGYETKTSYNVLVNGIDTGFVIYLLDDKIWVACMDIHNKPRDTYYLFELHKAYYD